MTWKKTPYKPLNFWKLQKTIETTPETTIESTKEKTKETELVIRHGLGDDSVKEVINQVKKAEIALVQVKPDRLGTPKLRHSDLWTTSHLDRERLVSGNDLLSFVAYQLSDSLFIYPGIGGQNYLGHNLVNIPEKVTSENHKIVKVLETRIGAGDVLLGSALNDSLVSCLLPSEALLHTLPNLEKLVRLRKPVVFHVNARSINANHSIQSDYSALFNAATTGISILGSSTAQQVHDLAIISHIAAIRSKSPFLHFFDGTTLANRTTKISILPDIENYVKTEQKLGRREDNMIKVVDSVMEDLSKVLGRRYQPIEYMGHKEPETVIVCMGTASAVVEDFVRANSNEPIGVLEVHLLRPWSADYFQSKIPKSTKKLVVLDQDKNSSPQWGSLYREVVASLNNPIRVIGGKISSNPSYESIRNIFSENQPHGFVLSNEVSNNTKPENRLTPLSPTQISFWEYENSALSPVSLIADSLSGHYKYIDYDNYYDTYCVKGVINTVLRYGQNPVSNNGRHRAVVCLNEKFLTDYDMLNSIQENGIFLLNCNTKELPNLPAAVKRDIVRKKILFKAVDTNAIVQYFSEAFIGNSAVIIGLCSIIFSLFHPEFNLASILPTKEAKDVAQWSIENVLDIKPGDDWLDAQDDVEQPFPTAVSGSILPQSAFKPFEKPKRNYTTSLTHASLFLSFQNVYQSKVDLRPVGASHGGIYRTKLTKWVRLTPNDYDRNIFHMEIGISGTTLKYDMGEALAVYGLNLESQVSNFLDFYGLNPNDIVCIGQHNTEYSIRTIYQLFIQYLDIFGRPSKKFYQALSEYAKDPKEREKLLYIISEAGQEDFKARVKETTTFEDLLREFPSAKPSVEDLLELIPPIKPRHYSIASSMKMHPDSVHLLVVVEDWKTPSGKVRVGQCSGYLARINNPETEDIYLTVSVAPSLMKLPPKNTQPVVMAGLGTGMAPFRAFIQERHYLQSKGEKVGPMALYFGSRFRAQEYLYGEELEAYHSSGLLTYLRLAFSRDQKEKVYIQHKLGSDKKEICDMLLADKGHFYLCGPTWPAGDVYDAIVGNFMSSGMTKEVAQETVYKMKEDGRYVLEVY